ncbi:RCS-specific HTH-type transcriptional activator RclR [Pontiella desulfatans]|uniref:RCS-specific HTH-type transcriptional activator RclR n=1 Tax=Pontiella desulfatans TaxID=2750659 RepID=A0A6C2TWB7_PONDE|nr:AraC family transcriptional regulator [Pontiella desulfatans]VGO11909.1 RCS-specific HTH-type transcriptional activator RclR [Pontiella desulfatans]
MKKPFQPLKFQTPFYEEDRPVFPDSPSRITPYILHNMKNWTWEVEVQVLTLQYVMGGRIRYALNGQTHEATKGTCFLFLPGQRLSGHALDDKPVTMFAAHFAELPATEASGELIHTPIREVSLFEEVAAYAVKRRQKDDERSTRHTETALLQLYHLLEQNLACGPVGAVQQKVEELIENIKHDPGRDWRVEVMCDSTGLSRSQLTRWFNRITGNAPNRYVIEHRIAQAVQMLGTSNCPITEIADSLGYRDVPFFIRQFRKETGMSPGSLRK